MVLVIPVINVIPHRRSSALLLLFLIVQRRHYPVDHVTHHLEAWVNDEVDET
jgi:hypothetical protein